MYTAALIIFVVTYIGIALGGVPGLSIDRTGIALLGAIAMVWTGIMSVEEALASVHTETILLLYSLMVVSAQLRLGGFYTWTALRITRWMNRPARFLFLLMVVSAGLSALLANDIVCLAFTPVLCYSLMRAGLNPVPFLIALAVSSNIGSAATIIGNPQNMLIGQVGELHFGRFLLWCGPPTVAALLAAYGVIVWLCRDRWHADFRPSEERVGWPAFDRRQSGKGLLLVVALVALFFTNIPRELSALAVAGILLCSRRMHTRAILGLVDWHLITLFGGLFIVIHGIEVSGHADRLMDGLNRAGLDLGNVYALTWVSAGLSNTVSNVPAVMLLVPFMDPDNVAPWHVLALSSTFAGNLITIGSIANLIVIVQAKASGVHISFRDHARIGVPVTLVSILITLIWIFLTT